MEDLIILGNASRTTASTGMNDFSSRSHAILTISFTQVNCSVEKFLHAAMSHIVSFNWCKHFFKVSLKTLGVSKGHPSRALISPVHPFCVVIIFNTSFHLQRLFSFFHLK